MQTCVILQVALTGNYSDFILEDLCIHVNAKLLQAIHSSKGSLMLVSTAL